MLFVSDPQILGETFDTRFYSGIAIHDSDEYLKKTYARAFAFTKPDVVCFLGDLLDEGSVATDEAYGRYVRRFNNIFKANASVRKIFIPGDNDIGGERSDYVTAFKTNRFRKSFNESSSHLINNRLRFLNINLLTHIYPELNETDTPSLSHKLLNIVLTHISLLSYPGLTMKTVNWQRNKLSYFSLEFIKFVVVGFRFWTNSNRISYFRLIRTCLELSLIRHRMWKI